MNFADNLYTLIEKRNMTQKELALYLNIAPSTLGSYVQNTSEPDFFILKLLAKYFDVSVDYLLDYTLDEKATNQEKEMLYIFHSLTEEQQYICIERMAIAIPLALDGG